MDKAYPPEIYVENSSIYAIRPALPLVETLKQRVHQYTTR